MQTKPILEIRHTQPDEIDRLMEIYAYAREFMVKNGNPRQWAAGGWPPRQLLEEDVKAGRSYVYTDEDGKIIATFCYLYGKDIEPTYAKIYDGAWRSSRPYGIVHRIAADGSRKGTGKYCIEWAYRQSSGYLRIDTHPDNKPMQHLLESMGFTFSGTIYVEEDDDPRMAYEKL